MAIQSAEGTIVDDFTTATAKRVWSKVAEIDPAPAVNDPAENHMSQGGGPPTEGEYETKEGPSGVIEAHCTPQSIEFFLRNNFGPFAAGSFSLASQVTEFLTLAWVENRFAPTSSTRRLVRIKDAWISALIIEVLATGMVTLIAQYSGSDRDVKKLNALGPVTLPPAPIDPTDRNLFAGRSKTLTRDPSGDNEKVEFDSLRIVLSQGLTSEWTMSDAWDISKMGNLIVTLELESKTADEQWNILDKATTQEAYRLTLLAASPAKTLTFDFTDVTFRKRPVGHDGQIYRPYLSVGYPKKNSSGSFVAISLT